jgi:hypothetical protein
VAPPRFDTAGSFSEGLAAGLVPETRRYVFINREGREVFAAPEGCGHVGDFSEGLVWASWRAWTSQGYLDREGRWVIEPRFQLATDFHEGLARVKIEGLYGYIDLLGQFKIEPRFESAEDFREGLAGVSLNGRCLLIDPAGAVFWQE